MHVVVIPPGACAEPARTVVARNGPEQDKVESFVLPGSGEVA